MSLEGELSQKEGEALIKQLHEWARNNNLPPVTFKVELTEPLALEKF